MHRPGIVAHRKGCRPQNTSQLEQAGLAGQIDGGGRLSLDDLGIGRVVLGPHHHAGQVETGRDLGIMLGRPTLIAGLRRAAGDHCGELLGQVQMADGRIQPAEIGGPSFQHPGHAQLGSNELGEMHSRDIGGNARQMRQRRRPRPFRPQRPAQRIEHQGLAALALQIIDAAGTKGADAAHQPDPAQQPLGMVVDDQPVEPGHGLGKAGEAGADQQSDLGLGVGLTDFVEGLEAIDQIAQSAQADHQNPLTLLPAVHAASRKDSASAACSTLMPAMSSL